MTPEREAKHRGRIISAIATLLHATYLDALPSTDDCDDWRRIAGDARLSLDELAKELAAQRDARLDAERERDALRARLELLTAREST